jgi:hypothetical protein
MGSVNLVVIVESGRDLLKHGDNALKLHIPSIVAVAAALGGPTHLPTLSVLIDQLEGVKFVLFLYCYSSRSRSSQVEVLWEDHRNDLFINSFGEISCLRGTGLCVDACAQASSCQLEAANWLGVCWLF